MKSATQGPFMVERHDRDDGVIVYELWTADFKELVLSIADDFNPRAKADAELICYLLNNQHPAVAETDADAQGECQPPAVFADPITLKQTIERETIERCARVAEARAAEYRGPIAAKGGVELTQSREERCEDYGLACESVASAIRALMPLHNGNGSDKM